MHQLAHDIAVAVELPRELSKHTCLGFSSDLLSQSLVVHWAQLPH